jgi:predicted membrane protein (TIGR00267 family)
LLFGFANLFADGLSMGLGNFLSLRSQKVYYLKQKEKEKTEINVNPADELQETVYLFKREGFNDSQSQKLASMISQNKDYWLKFMMQNEIEMEDQSDKKPFINGLVTFLSFVVFGFLPVLPFLLPINKEYLFYLSLLFGFLAMITLGLFRWKVTKEKLFTAVFETVIVGVLASTVAFLVGVMFNG